jgi:hypothetical protein
MPFRNKFASPRTNIAILLNLDTNVSWQNILLCRSILDSEIGVAPAYQARIHDDIHICPSINTFNNFYQLLCLPSLTSKTRGTVFQVLNQTVRTNNKAFKSRMRNDPQLWKMWKDWNNGTFALWMSALLATSLDSAWWGHHTILELNLPSTCPRSRDQPT